MSHTNRFTPFYLVIKAFLVSFFMFNAMNEVRHHGWTHVAFANLAVAAVFTVTTFLILYMAQKRGVL
jgi:hypothetical protein